MITDPQESCEAEFCTVSSMLLDDQATTVARQILDPADFFWRKFGLYFEALCALQDENKPADNVLVKQRLLDTGVFDEAGGEELLVALCEGVPSTANARYYADIVKEKSLRRQMIANADRLKAAADGDYQDIEDAANEAQHTVQRMSEKPDDKDPSIGDADDIAHLAIRDVEHHYQHPGEHAAIQTGCDQIDYATAGLWPGNYIIVAAVTGGGKTTFATSLTAHLCEQGRAVLYVSVEMTPKEIMKRLLAAQADISLSRIRTGRIFDDKKEWDRLTEAEAGIARWKLRIIGKSISVSEIRTAIGQFVKKYKRPADLVVVDYIQKIRGEGKSRYEVISGVSNDLKMLALDMNVSILAAAQLGRDVGKENRRPTKYDLKESGEIENDSDVVFLMHRDEKVMPDIDGIVNLEVKIDKNRNGPQTPWPDEGTDGIILQWKPSITRIFF